MSGLVSTVEYIVLWIAIGEDDCQGFGPGSGRQPKPLALIPTGMTRSGRRARPL
ncbi:hypothetical protein PMI09_05549 [Rhizobium sp. CF122]|nr:hypothetical protein PMI09_05549 [Rhizobium sp. CF122]